MPIGINLFPDLPLGASKKMYFLDKKDTIQSIISIFETGKAAGDYGACVILPDGAGISYGKHQATDRANSLDQIILTYQDLQGEFSEEFDQYLKHLADNDSAKIDRKNPPTWCVDLMALLKKAANDPIMHAAQDNIFDSNYWEPAVKQIVLMKLTSPLSAAIVYDTCIHSGPGGVAKIRKLFPESPPSGGGDEKRWVVAYVKARKKWLLGFSNPLVQKTVYRMEEFQKIIDNGNWDLTLPFKVHGVVIS